MAEISMLIVAWTLPTPDWVKGVATTLCTIGLFWKAVKIGLLLGDRE